MIHPSGSASPRSRRTRIFPDATAAVEKSITMGGEPGSGTAAATGLVPNAARLPPNGANRGCVPPPLTNAMATSPRSAAISG